jgi:predicted RecA/RadA family phage recombinase
MSARFIYDGNRIDYTPSADVASGDVVIQGDLVGIAKLDIAANSLGALAVTGVFDLDKVTGVGTAITVGAKVYVIPSGDDLAKATADSDDGEDPATAYVYAGKALVAAGDDDTAVRVRLGQ